MGDNVLIYDLSKGEARAIDPKEYNRSVRTEERKRAVRLVHDYLPCHGAHASTREAIQFERVDALTTAILADDAETKDDEQEPAHA